MTKIIKFINLFDNKVFYFIIPVLFKLFDWVTTVVALQMPPLIQWINDYTYTESWIVETNIFMARFFSWNIFIALAVMLAVTITCHSGIWLMQKSIKISIKQGCPKSFLWIPILANIVMVGMTTFCVLSNTINIFHWKTMLSVVQR